MDESSQCFPKVLIATRVWLHMPYLQSYTIFITSTSCLIYSNRNYFECVEFHIISHFHISKQVREKGILGSMVNLIEFVHVSPRWMDRHGQRQSDRLLIPDVEYLNLVLHIHLCEEE
jgi:hypothetical protein